MRRAAWAVCFALSVWSGRATDVFNYFVSKGVVYSQTNAGAPELKRSPYVFHARAELSNRTAIAQASISRGFFEDALVSLAPKFASTVRMFSSASALNIAYPNTNYTFVIQTTHDGVRSNTFTLPAASFPSAPHIANYEAAQSVDAADGFTLLWDFWPQGTGDDLISLLVFNGRTSDTIAFQTSSTLGSTNALTGESVSVTIPPSVLTNGSVYLARLRFDKILGVNVTNYPGAPSFASLFSTTDFYIKTLGGEEPRVVYVSPSNGAANVPVSTSVSWAFNRPVRTNALSYSFPSGSAVRRTWSGGNFVLTFTPTNSWLSANTTINWGLQIWNDTVFIVDADGGPLFPDTWGSFTTGSSTNPPAQPVPPQLGIPNAAGADAHLSMTALADRSYMLQSASRLTNWSMAALVTAASNSISITDTNAASAAQKFYRAIALP